MRFWDAFRSSPPNPAASRRPATRFSPYHDCFNLAGLGRPDLKPGSRRPGDIVDVDEITLWRQVPRLHHPFPSLDFLEDGLDKFWDSSHHARPNSQDERSASKTLPSPRHWTSTPQHAFLLPAVRIDWMQGRGVLDMERELRDVRLLADEPRRRRGVCKRVQGHDHVRPVGKKFGYCSHRGDVGHRR